MNSEVIHDVLDDSNRDLIHWHYDERAVPSCVLTRDGILAFESSKPLERLAVVATQLLDKVIAEIDSPIITYSNQQVFTSGLPLPWADEVTIYIDVIRYDTLEPSLFKMQKVYNSEGSSCLFCIKHLHGWDTWSLCEGEDITEDPLPEENDQHDSDRSPVDRSSESDVEVEEGSNRETGYVEPTPFGTHDTEPFPLHALSNWQADFVSALAETGQFTETGIAPLLLGVMAGCLQARVEVQPKPDPSYREPVNLYVLVAAPSSAGKSPVLGILGAPLELAQERMKAAAGVRREAATAEFLRVEKEIAKLVDAMVEGEDCEAELLELIQRRSELDGVRTCQGRLVTQEPTPEALARILSAEGSIVLMADEVHLPTLTGTRWGGQSNLTLPLQAYSGTPFSSDRVTSGELYVPRPLLTIVGGIQPAVVGQFMATQDVVKRGFAGRTFIVFAGDRFGSRTYETKAIPDQLLRRYARMVERLTALPSHRSAPPRLLFSGDALTAQTAFFGEIDREAAQNRDSDRLSFLGKIVGGAARIAGILHAVRHSKHNVGIGLEISGETMESAIEIARFFKSHAEIAYNEIENREDIQILVWGKIIGEGMSEFSANELFGRLKGSRFVKHASDLHGPLTGLVRRNFLVPLPAEDRSGQPGRKPSPRFGVNPRAVEIKLPRAKH